MYSRTPLGFGVGCLGVVALAFMGNACTEDFAEPNAFTRPEGGTTTTGTIDPNQPPAPFDAGQGTGDPPQDKECDLSGRWFVAQRVLASAIGQDQAAHNWFYFEVRHEKADVVVLKGLHCGYEVIKKSGLSAAVDSSAVWPAFLEKNTSTGRKGTFVKEGANCKLHLAKEYVVRGATTQYYNNPSTTMPTKTQQATATTPGWEDWDNDGNPGISLKVSSPLASGTLYCAQRDWTEYDGTTALSSTKFKVSIKYGGTQVALGRADGTPQAVETASSPSADASQHYAWFYKLSAGQATGSDADICNAVRGLRSEVPEANQ